MRFEIAEQTPRLKTIQEATSQIRKSWPERERSFRRRLAKSRQKLILQLIADSCLEAVH